MPGLPFILPVCPPLRRGGIPTSGAVIQSPQRELEERKRVPRTGFPGYSINWKRYVAEARVKDICSLTVGKIAEAAFR